MQCDRKLKIQFLFAFCLTLGQISVAQHKPDKDLNDLRGSVRTVRTMTYFVEKSGKTVKKGVQSESTETYNRQGNLTETRSGFGQMSASKSTFQRDAEGNRIEKLTSLQTSPNPPPPPPLPQAQLRACWNSKRPTNSSRRKTA